MPSITAWTRLEPRCRNPEMRAGLEARVHDPLWLLARQWQLGEFRGSDAGSPVLARFHGDTVTLDRYAPGNLNGEASSAASAPLDATIPLEVMVEREGMRRGEGPLLRLAVEAGLHFLRLLRREGSNESTRAAFIQGYPLRSIETGADARTLRFGRMAAGRVPDGLALHEAMRDAADPVEALLIALPAALGVGSPPERAKLESAVVAWRRWYGGLFSEPGEGGSAWVGDRMEYAFAASARLPDREVVLSAREYVHGHLDWHAFEVETGRALGAAPRDASAVTEICIPSPVTFRGMPASRWWEFEDRQVDLGAIEAEREDLARLLLVEFALVYGNDWFVIPVELRAGSLCEPRSLVVEDTFGRRTSIPPCTRVDGPQGSWRMFHLSPDFFFLPPSLGPTLHGPVVEEVLLLRDETANMAWAIERTVESAAGHRLDRFEAFQQQAAAGAGRAAETSSAPAAAAAALRYRIATGVPPHWIPYLPERVAERSVRLRRGIMLQADGSPRPDGAKGRILAHERTAALFEEEVPREGVRVTRAYQFARWVDGSSHLWVARRKQPGRGEGASGLRFDLVEPA